MLHLHGQAIFRWRGEFAQRRRVAARLRLGRGSVARGLWAVYQAQNHCEGYRCVGLSLRVWEWSRRWLAVSRKRGAAC
ncbi:MAG: hypothetical protein B7Y02_18890, partial [Rhodobacterales bacterium 17-64-5]